MTFIGMQRYPVNSIREVLRLADKRLTPTSPTPCLDAEVLMAHMLKTQRSYLHSRPEKALKPNQLKEFRNLIDKRYAGQPIAYLTGHREFWSLEFEVTPDVLIPRPETELLIEVALNIIPKHKDWMVADIGTGSGAIAVALAHERTRIAIDACDNCNHALAIAKNNAEKHNAHNISFYWSDWLSNLPDQKYQLIISNPPYIAETDPHLQQGDVRFEPIVALQSGNHGFNALKSIASQARPRLAANGYLLLEHGYTQADQLASVLSQFGFSNITVFPDLLGHQRVTIARWIPRNCS